MNLKVTKNLRFFKEVERRGVQNKIVFASVPKSPSVTANFDMAQGSNPALNFRYKKNWMKNQKNMRQSN